MLQVDRVRLVALVQQALVDPLVLQDLRVDRVGLGQVGQQVQVVVMVQQVQLVHQVLQDLQDRQEEMGRRDGQDQQEFQGILAPLDNRVSEETLVGLVPVVAMEEMAEQVLLDQQVSRAQVEILGELEPPV